MLMDLNNLRNTMNETLIGGRDSLLFLCLMTPENSSYVFFKGPPNKPL